MSRVDPSITQAELNKALTPFGLVCFGGFVIEPDDCPVQHNDLAGCEAWLIGNAGGAMWEIFSASCYFSDGKPDPLNRWTEETLGRVAQSGGYEPIFPFGEERWPFQRFGKRCMGLSSSPLGMLIHPEFGLSHAYRAALVNPENAVSGFAGSRAANTHPCDTCQDKPCLEACPVSAFNGESLDVSSCFAHLDSKDDPQCTTMGCAARNACPVGSQYRYTAAQIQFHMRSYRG